MMLVKKLKLVGTVGILLLGTQAVAEDVVLPPPPQAPTNIEMRDQGCKDLLQLSHSRIVQFSQSGAQDIALICLGANASNQDRFNAVGRLIKGLADADDTINDPTRSEKVAFASYALSNIMDMNFPSNADVSGLYAQGAVTESEAKNAGIPVGTVEGGSTAVNTSGSGN
jgi:hypothetical protein